MKKVAKFEIKTSEDGKIYFVLIAPNGEVIATSEMYESREACIKGMRAVKKYAKTAKIAK